MSSSTAASTSTLARPEEPKMTTSADGIKENKKLPAIVNLPGQFKMERILKKRIYKKKKLQYLIKWDGYDSEDNTWEPAENIIDKSMVNAFEASLAEAARKKKEELKDKENKGKVVAERKAPSRPRNLPVVSSTYSESTLTSMLPPSSSTIVIKKEEKPLDEVPNIKATRVLGVGYDEVYKELRYLVEYEGGIGHHLTSDEIKERHPMLLLDFFEEHFTCQVNILGIKVEEEEERNNN